MIEIAMDMQETPQTHWLQHLDQAHHFHKWVFDGIGPLPGKNVLEVGCGIGTYTNIMAEAGYDVTALDINPDYVEHCARRFVDRPQIDVRLEDATSPPADGELWDAAIMLDVLEHLPDDVSVLKGLSGRLTVGGVLAIKVPAHDWLRGSLDDAVGHYRRYNRQSLSQAFRDAGYEVISIKPFNVMAMPGWWLNSRLLQSQVAPSNQIRLFERLVPLGRILDLINPFAIGTSLIATARKM